MEHPPYSPDLASSDFLIFTCLVYYRPTMVRYFVNDDETESEMKMWLRL